jgi:hypothetical protein
MATKMTKSEIVKKTTAPKRVRATQTQRDQAQTTDHASIAQRAYERFMARGMTHGYDVEDWLAAEQELSAT